MILKTCSGSCFDLSSHGIKIYALLLNTTKPNASLGLIFEKYILIAYFARVNRWPSPFFVNPELMDPEISRQTTELRILWSLPYPSLFPFTKIAKYSWTYESKELSIFWHFEYPIWSSIGLSAFLPIVKGNSLNAPS